MKNFLIATCLIIASTSSLANSWSNQSFPVGNPIYHTIGKHDTSQNSKLNFSCTENYKKIILMTLSSIELSEKSGTFKFKSSKKDKIETEIKGVFSTSEDGIVNLITGYSKKILLDDMKQLNGVNLTLSSNNKEIKTLEYELSGSSKHLNIFTQKCSTLK